MRHHMSLTVLAVLLAVMAPDIPIARGQQAAKTHVRLNRLASLLDEDKAAFGLIVNSGSVGGGPADAVGHANNRDLDLVVYDLEHSPFDVAALRTYMQFLLDPGAIARAGDVKATKAVFVRIPAYGREVDKNHWMIKNVLDTGVHGLVFPHIETPEQALGAVRAMRYPQKPGAPDFEPEGLRGSSAATAARYWGLPVSEYMEQSDIWRLDPAGNLIPWFLIENKLGVANVREIARQLKASNVGAVLWAGTGDLGVSYSNDQQAVAKAVDTILAAGREFGLPVAMNGSANVRSRMEQGARIFMGGITAEARKEAGR